jgi:post-segregation antitoxin (ccd killing protein)
VTLAHIFDKLGLMGKEHLTIEVDADLMERLRKAGVDPQAYVERLLARSMLANESDAEREARHAALRAEMKQGTEAYEAFIEEHGLWSDGLRQF